MALYESNVVTSNGATAVQIVPAAPTGGVRTKQRKVTHFRVYNSDAGAHPYTLAITDGTTSITIKTNAALAAGATEGFSAGELWPLPVGWRATIVSDAGGAAHLSAMALYTDELVDGYERGDQ